MPITREALSTTRQAFAGVLSRVESSHSPAASYSPDAASAPLSSLVRFSSRVPVRVPADDELVTPKVYTSSYADLVDGRGRLLHGMFEPDEPLAPLPSSPHMHGSMAAIADASKKAAAAAAASAIAATDADSKARREKEQRSKHRSFANVLFDAGRPPWEVGGDGRDVISVLSTITPSTLSDGWEPSADMLLAAPPDRCCAVLCCAVLCAAVLCCALLCAAVRCCALLCAAVRCCALLCAAVRCCALLWLLWLLRCMNEHVGSGTVLLMPPPPPATARRTLHADRAAVRLSPRACVTGSWRRRRLLPRR
jgi:hypothetical protein